MVEVVASAVEVEKAAEAEAVLVLQEEFEAAAERVLGPSHRDVWRRPKERVRPAQADPRSGADLTCRAPATIWRRLQSASPKGDGATVHTVSEFGLCREVVYGSAQQLADAIVAASLEAPSSKAALLAASILPRDDGSLQIVTQLHLRRQRVAGRLHCASCGLFLNGERGLRDHVQIKHKNTYQVAKEAVAAARGAIVAYSPLNGAGGELARLWAARVAATEHARHSLPPGLAAARDGDLARIKELVASGRLGAALPYASAAPLR